MGDVGFGSEVFLHVHPDYLREMREFIVGDGAWNELGVWGWFFKGILIRVAGLPILEFHLSFFLQLRGD